MLLAKLIERPPIAAEFTMPAHDLPLLGSLRRSGHCANRLDSAREMGPLKVMFLDESGNHGLTKLDLDYPLFVLGGVIVESDYLDEVIAPRMRRFKRRLFGSEDLILHTADIARNKNGFENLKDRAFREAFFHQLNDLMSELSYTVVACAIIKDQHLARYGMAAVDPYLLSLGALVESFCFEIGDVGSGGIIIAEKRSPVLDREIDIAWLNLKVQGTQQIKAVDVNKRIATLQTVSKSRNIAGLQLADLVVSPIGRHLLGRSKHPDWRIVESKLRRSGGPYDPGGLIVLPDLKE